MFISKVNKGLTFKGNVVAMSVGQKTSNKELVDMYPSFFEKIEDGKTEIVTVETVSVPVVEETKVDLTDEIEALEDKLEVKETKKEGFKLFGRKK